MISHRLHIALEISPCPVDLWEFKQPILCKLISLWELQQITQRLSNLFVIQRNPLVEHTKNGLWAPN